MPKRTIESRRRGHNFGWVEVFNGHVVAVGEQSFREKESGMTWSPDFRDNYSTIQEAMTSISRRFPDFYEIVRAAAPKDKLVSIKRIEKARARKRMKRLTEEVTVLERLLKSKRTSLTLHKKHNDL